MMHTLLCRRVVSILYKYTTYYTSSILIIHNTSLANILATSS